MKRLIATLAALLLAPHAFAEALIDNVDGMTLDDHGRTVHFTGLLIDNDGKVSRLLDRGERRPKKVDWVIDMHGKVLIPGMIDAHGHVMELGMLEQRLDLSDTGSLAEAQAKLAAYAKAHPGAGWILGGGWNQEKWGLGRFPTAADIDEVVSDRPVYLMRVDGHAALANSRAMQAAGVTAASTPPPGGRIETGATGPSGVFVDTARDLIEKAIPQPTPRERNDAFLKAQEKLLSVGVTATADMGTSVDDWLLYRRMGDLGLLRIRIMSYGLGVETALRVGGQGPTPWLYQDRLRMGGIKLYADGALGSRGAWLKAPYSDAPGQSGAGFLRDEQMLNSMSRGAMDHFQLAVHAIGDRANQQVLDAIDILSETYRKDERWRIEHAQIVDPEDLPRFGKHGIIASMQPTHQTSDMDMAEARLGPDRLAGAYAWRAMLENGAKLAFGSDYPVESPNPFVGWAVAFTRTDAQGNPPGGWRPDQAVTREQAWRAFTVDAAYAGFAEEKFGRLSPGLRADFLIVDRDPLTATPAQLRRTHVLETWIGGARVWEKDPKTSEKPKRR